MFLRPQSQAKRLLIASVLIITSLSLLSFTIAGYLSRFLGSVEVTIAGLISNLILTVGVLLIYYEMAQDQEAQTELIKRQVDIAEAQQQIMEVDHLPKLELEIDLNPTDQESAGTFPAVTIHNHGNGTAQNIQFGVNVHLMLTDDNTEHQALNKHLVPVFFPVYVDIDEERELRIVRPDESVKGYIIPDLRGISSHAHGWSASIPGDVSEWSQVPEVEAVAWQPVLRYDTLLGTRGRDYRVFPPRHTSSEVEHFFYDSISLVEDAVEMGKTTLVPSRTYDDDPFADIDAGVASINGLTEFAQEFYQRMQNRFTYENFSDHNGHYDSSQ